MPAIPIAGTYARPSTTSIFLQPIGGVGFVPLLLTQASIPSSDRVSLNLSESETVTRRWNVVRNPINRIVAQNRIQEPDEITVVGVLSATPLLSALTHTGIARLDRSELDKLRNMLESSTSFVVTPDRILPNMACVRMVEDYSEDAEAVRLTLDFVEMTIVTPGVTDAALDLDNLGIGAGSEENLGPQTAVDVPDLGGLG